MDGFLFLPFLLSWKKIVKGVRDGFSIHLGKLFEVCCCTFFLSFDIFQLKKAGIFVMHNAKLFDAKETAHTVF
jgi:hypothetical protein